MMIIAKVQGQVVLETGHHTTLFPNTSFPSSGPNASFLIENGCMEVISDASYNHQTDKLVPVDPYISGNQVFTVAVQPLTQEELDAAAAVKTQAFINQTVAATQSRLDLFAKSRNYDGILSACTYATSSVPKFAAEGQYCVNARDTTWATLYTVMGEVQAGTKPMPGSVEEVMALLPVLEWPQ